MKDEHTPDEAPVEVTLPALLGVRPGIYLTVLYGAVLLALLFVLLILPGIRNRGELLTIRSLPSGAAVMVDGRYAGATPLKVFVPAGERSITLEKPGYEFGEQKISIGGRLFASRFFPKKRSVELSFSGADPGAIFSSLFTALSGYALMEDYRENYQAPPLVTPVMRDMMETGLLSREKLYEYLYMMLPNISNETMLRDYYDAYALLRAADGVRFENEREGLAALIADSAAASGVDPGLLELSFGKAEKPEAVALSYPGTGTPGGTIVEVRPAALPAAGSSFAAGGVRFTWVPGALFTAGSPDRSAPALPLDSKERDLLPALVNAESFFIAVRETTVGDYRRFIADNPRWAPANRVALEQAGLADGEYLTEWSAGGEFSSLPDSRPLSGISWFAAEAYCRWLDARLPEGMEEWSVVLPSEELWELAALRNGAAPSVFADNAAGVLTARFERYGAAGAADLSGNLWEWTSSWYLPLSRLYLASGTRPRLPQEWSAAERSVRGGSWANRSDMTPYHQRASQDPAWCTPFLGFRPAVVRKGAAR